MTLGVNVFDMFDPADPAGWTGAFSRAMATGRNVLVPAGVYDLEKGTLPALAFGQRLIGEGPNSSLHFRGNGDAIRLSSWVDANVAWFSAVENMSVYGRDAGPGGGVVVLGGGECRITNVVVGGFEVGVDLDGTNHCYIDGLTFKPYGDGLGLVPRHSLRFTEGAEGGRGWTVLGATNANRVRNLMCNQTCSDATVQLGGTTNSIDGFFCNSGRWRFRGRCISLTHGGFEFSAGVETALFADDVGVAGIGLFVDDVHVSRGLLLDIAEQTTIYGLSVERFITQGAHVVRCAGPYNVAGFARIAGDHWGSDRAVNIEQVSAENAISQVFEPYTQNRKVGIGTLRPCDYLLDVRNSGVSIRKHMQVRGGDVQRWAVEEP